MMNNKWYLVFTVMKSLIGILAITLFIIMAVDGENVTRWIPAVILAAVYVVAGIIEIISYKKQK